MRRKILFLMVLALGVGLDGISVRGAGERVGEQFINAGRFAVVSTTLVSVSSNRELGNSGSYFPSISGDGRFVTFHSSSNNLVAGDNNHKEDIFVHNRQTGATTRVSVASNGWELNNDSNNPSISADGQFVAFDASNFNQERGMRAPFVAQDVFVHDRQTGATTPASVSSNGIAGDYSSYKSSLSADGRFVAFWSMATNLVVGDNHGADIFVHDRQTGATTRVSVDSNGAEASGESYKPSISADGRFVAFLSSASNLVAGDNNHKEDIFVHDRQTGATSRVSVSSDGEEGNRDSHNPSISRDGRFVAFWSRASNLVAGDNNNESDIFVHDRQAGETTRVSVSNNGTEGNGDSHSTSISADGRFVAFASLSNNLVTMDNNNKDDVFVHDRRTGKTIRVSASSNGAEGNDWSKSPSISGDGRFVAFESFATNLVVGDNNWAQDIFLAELSFEQNLIEGPGINVGLNVPEGARNEDLPLSPQLPPEPRCTDSDGGEKPKIFGQVSGTIADPNRQEGRASRYVFQDKCCGKSYLREQLCEGDESRVQWYRCNCRKGECVKGLWPMPIDRRQAPRECEEDLF